MKADLILYSSAIFDSVGDKPFSGGVAVAGEKIIAVGPREDIKSYEGEQTVVKELGDRLVMPGFCESHGHFPMGAEFFSDVACHDMEECRSEQECADRVKEFADAHPELPIITGNGWYVSYWGEGASFPTKDS